MLFSKNLNVLTLAIASSRADVVVSLLAPADDASSSHPKKKGGRRRELLLRGMEQRMDLMKAERANDEADVDPNTGADVGDLSFRDGEVDEEIGENEGRILAPDEDASCQNCVGFEACLGVDEKDIGCQSCKGDDACRGSGATYVNVGDHSCNDREACESTNSNIGDHSCNAPKACNSIQGGTYSSIGGKSCNAEKACSRLIGHIGGNSCNAEGACFRAGNDCEAPGYYPVNIGSKSCNAYYACAGLDGNEYIAPNTCNEPCECCGPNFDCTLLPKCPTTSTTTTTPP